MAAYCTALEVAAVLARDVRDSYGTGADMFDGSILDFHISAAQAEVDAVLTSRYKVPFNADAVPALVKSLTVDVAAYLATLTYRQDVDLGADDPVRLRYQRAEELLAKLSTGQIDLPGAGSEDPPAQAGGARVVNQYSGRLFGLEDWGLGHARAASRRRGSGAIDGW